MAIDIERISRLEGTYEQVDRRLDDMHQASKGYVPRHRDYAPR